MASAKYILDFEKPIVELEKKIQEMKESSASEHIDLSEDITKLESKLDQLRQNIFSKLTNWQRVQLARHPERPYPLDYIERICSNFEELHGDRYFGDDHAVVAVMGIIENEKVMICAHQKGRDTKSNLYRNFGMPNPEGLRKALRVMKLGAKFGRPIVTFIDTPGAFPGKGAEERGISDAIARNLYEMATLPVPILTVVTGEGGSGGALALSVADRILMMEYSMYSVISPEGCASILYRDSTKASIAADSLKLTAPDLLELKVVDGTIPEPIGGAHRNYDEMAKILKARILKELNELKKMDTEQRINERIEKYGKMGFWEE
ncbi:acetyl-CoA carboxylase carboxyltransferase subunit alpha [candidate division KSB1 bacterium]